MTIDTIEGLSRLLLRRETDTIFVELLRAAGERPAIETQEHVRSCAFAKAGMHVLLRREGALSRHRASAVAEGFAGLRRVCAREVGG